jgi:hypothetical protein
MPKHKPPPHLRKRRTRAHIIADLSINLVERHALQCGFAVERFRADYGIDLMLLTYDRDGQWENGAVLMQVKATDGIKPGKTDTSIAFQIKRADLEWWLNEEQPVILIVYDAQLDVAYWLYVQAYFESRPKLNLSNIPATITVYLESKNVVNESAMREFARFRDAVKLQQRGKIRHHV